MERALLAAPALMLRGSGDAMGFIWANLLTERLEVMRSLVLPAPAA